MNKPLVSIIIPYYNGGEFLLETISSAISQTYSNVEVVLVDDGSDDPVSIKLFDELNHPMLRKYRTKNQGLPMARNTAISMAFGDFILPLDSDDLVSNEYIEKAICEYGKNNRIGIVYSHAKFFGDVDQYWNLPEYNEIDFLSSNCIFCSGIFKKSDWKAVGGYKSDMVYGLEDYDFWLSLIGLGREVIRLPEIHFFYRKHGDSMISSLKNDKLNSMYEIIVERHKNLYQKNLVGLLAKINYLSNKVKDLEARVA
jgi:glycosyltransferase involved in cell wall biosynthesis